MHAEDAGRCTSVAAAGLSSAHALAAFCATLLVALMPLLFVTYPPLHDYPAHLARVDILTRWQTSPELQRWYDLRSFLLPNVGMDLPTWLLARFTPITVAGRLFVALTLTAMLGGTVALHRVLFGRFRFWPLVAATLLFNWILLYGFLSYLLGIGLLLWAAAAWIALARSKPSTRVAVGTGLSLLLFFCHFVALFLFAAVVAGYEFHRFIEMRKTDAPGGRHELLVGALIFLVPFALFVLSSTAGKATATIGYEHPFLYSKVFAVWRACMAGDWTLDVVLSTAVAFGFAIVCLNGNLRIAPPMKLALVFLLLAFALTPERLFNARQMDSRMPVAIAFVAIAAVDPVVRSRRLRTALLLGVAILLLFRAVFLSATWRSYDVVIERFTASFARLPDGAVLFTASTAPIPTMNDIDLELWQPPLKHVASLASLGRTLFVPATWAHLGQQPITVAERYRPMYEFQGQNPIPVESEKILGFLIGRLRRLAASVGEPDAPLYLLLLYPERLHLDVPKHAHLAASDPLFTLLSVDPPAMP